MTREHTDLSWEFISHAPKDYSCPFCGLYRDDVGHHRNLCELSDLIYRDEHVMVFIASHGFLPNPGHPMVVPAKHIESLYLMDDQSLLAVSRMRRDIAIALKRALKCDGITIRQNNEPHGSQHVWHYHDHVIPRWENDGLQPQVRPIVEIPRRAELATTLARELERMGYSGA